MDELTIQRLLKLELRIAALEKQQEQAGRRIPRVVQEPTPSVVNRGRVYRLNGAAGEEGTADTMKVILKGADGTYSAVTIATG